MGIDEINIFRLQPGCLDRVANCTRRAIAAWFGRGNVIGIAGDATAAHFGQQLCAARPRMGFAFQDHDAGAFAANEAVAFFVERPAGMFRVFVARRERPHAGKGGHRQSGHRRLAAAGNHHIGLIALNQVVALDQGIVAAGAGRGGGHDRAARAQLDGDDASDRIGHHVGNEERPHRTRPLFNQAHRAWLHFGDAAAAGVHQNRDAFAVIRGDGEVGVGQGFVGGRHGQLNGARSAARRLAIHELAGVKILHFASDPHR